ncbi:MAG: GNAT family N-acetyltransferase [Chitinophagales bacterium]
MKISPEIIPVKITDHYEVISGMMHKLHLHEQVLFNKTAEWVDIEAGYMRHITKMQDECEGLFLMAYVDKVPAGFIFGYLDEQDDSRIEIHEGKELYISDGYVAKEFRSHGIYHKLNDQLEQHFIAKGIKRIIRFTLINNTPMRRFLEREEYMVTRLLYEKWL